MFTRQQAADQRYGIKRLSSVWFWHVILQVHGEVTLRLHRPARRPEKLAARVRLNIWPLNIKEPCPTKILYAIQRECQLEKETAPEKFGGRCRTAPAEIGTVANVEALNLSSTTTYDTKLRKSNNQQFNHKLSRIPGRVFRLASDCRRLGWATALGHNPIMEAAVTSGAADDDTA